ncbi:MAG: TetR/AcrR family transcriptional regulator [Tetrasphaera sp.]
MTPGKEAGQDERPTRDRLVLATAELLRRNGYAATGVKAILTSAHAPYGSMYHFFPGGKEELAAAAVSSSGAAYRDHVAVLFPPGADLEQTAREAFGLAAEFLASIDYAEACPVAAVALETANHSEPIRMAASHAFDSWLEVLRDRGRSSGLDEDAAGELAQTLFMLLQGAFLLARTRRDSAPLLVAGEAAADAVRSHLDRAAQREQAAPMRAAVDSIAARHSPTPGPSSHEWGRRSQEDRWS